MMLSINSCSVAAMLIRTRAGVSPAGRIVQLLLKFGSTVEVATLVRSADRQSVWQVRVKHLAIWQVVAKANFKSPITDERSERTTGG